MPRQPLRFVLADDPGAGKTIMAGLYIRELLLRADAERILIVAPGSLVEQWREELLEKFDLRFQVVSPGLIQAAPSGNPFADFPRLIARLDQLARNETLQDQACAAGWDLIVFDEAHKLAAHFFGTKLEKTGRFRLAEALGAETRHLLLMTATPHNGKEEDFQLFLSLLDSDRFYGKFRDGVHQVDASDLMRRLVKEELVKFDGTPLFPERSAYTVNYELSPPEVALYEAVTAYVQTEMGKADEIGGKRRNSVGFALTALQRRLASSPEAIYQSLKRRRERLESRLREEKLGLRAQTLHAETLDGLDLPEDDDDLNAEEQETLEETLVDQATAARTVAELESEIVFLRGLEHQAKTVVASGQDRKWDELSRLLQHRPEMQNDAGRQRKLIIFSEHRDTLNYLHARIAGVLGREDAIVVIHGCTHGDERKKRQAQFRSDPKVRILIATDAAGEGVNLQNANLMVNYDLPWNPNRLEQRFGRIHRIGQTEVCHLWNLVAAETREGDVYARLLTKLEIEGQALNGRVFDILGEVFENIRLRDLLLEAIRYGDQPEVRARLTQRIETALDHQRLQDLLARNALTQETLGPEQLFKVKRQMEEAEARRLQPYFVRAFFLRAFEALHGSAHRREQGRFEITHVPASLRERDRRLSGRNRRETEPVLARYERICFERDATRLADRPGDPGAVLMHPGHPLMLAMTDVLLERHGNLLRQGAILVDPADDGLTPHLLLLLTHKVQAGDGTILSTRLQFVRVAPDGQTQFAGWAPHLDLEPLGLGDRKQELGDSEEAGCPIDDEGTSEADDLIANCLPLFPANIEDRAVALATATLAPVHYQEIAERRIAHIEKTLVAVHERLTKEISFWTDRWERLREDKEAGKDVRLNLDNAQRTILDLQGRLDRRKRELEVMRHVINSPPAVIGAALVIPAGLLRQRRGRAPAEPDVLSADAQARAHIEQLAMTAVRHAEEARGWTVEDVSAAKCGWDLTAYPPANLQPQPLPRHIEVKGRAAGATTVTITRNEMLYAFNQGAKFVLAIVLVHPDDRTEGPYYLRNPFDREPAWGVASVNYALRELLGRASPQASG
ncbi:helicase-related protein [Thiorhodovibrio winogradskyi]|uniref:helicase-related protein n=1 Tax=Thiorhodovibrio winogradskyi TaxID=77007 RepID=UPI002E28AAC3|nr:helicase-related protein [Thiorhodovibrio winogradskyi]